MWRGLVHGKEGAPLRLPYHGDAKSVSTSEFSLLSQSPDGTFRCVAHAATC